MNDQFQDLIQREVEGDLSDTERRTLDELCSADPTLHEAREQMRELVDDLDSLAWHEVPATLKQNVMREIDASAPVRPRSSGRSPRRVDSRLALAFAAGIALMIVIGRFVPIIGDVDPEQAAGTMISAQNPSVQIERASLTSGEAQVDVRTALVSQRLLVTAKGQGALSQPLRIEWEPTIWSLASMPVLPLGDLEVDAGHLSFVQAIAGPFILEIELQPLRPADSGAEEIRVQLGSTARSESTARLGATP